MLGKSTGTTKNVLEPAFNVALLLLESRHLYEGSLFCHFGSHGAP